MSIISVYALFLVFLLFLFFLNILLVNEDLYVDRNCGCPKATSHEFWGDRGYDENCGGSSAAPLRQLVLRLSCVESAVSRRTVRCCCMLSSTLLSARSRRGRWQPPKRASADADRRRDALFTVGNAARTIDSHAPYTACAAAGLGCCRQYRDRPRAFGDAGVNTQHISPSIYGSRTDVSVDFHPRLSCYLGPRKENYSKKDKGVKEVAVLRHVVRMSTCRRS